ncbi:angiopoietin-related protein 5-like [Mixophyes fleayi]|uniref:angiopoietin-related protein 5-like n=1 Tax=Mixophyes fleayi TaxID=3061075 RepID=UPI003F4DC911
MSESGTASLLDAQLGSQFEGSTGGGVGMSERPKAAGEEGPSCAVKETGERMGGTAPKGLDCSDIWARNKASTSGIYTIKPEGASTSFQVFCEMTAAGGWTLIQKHTGEDGLSFQKLWADYENGFGGLGGEHWLGLKYIYLLTHQGHRSCKLRISTGDFAGNQAYAEYNPFSVGDANNFYRLSAGTYSGTAGDAFRGDTAIPGSNQHGNFFTTQDSPHDKCHPICLVGDIRFESCSQLRGSGWWFNACGEANLNGNWRSPPNVMYWASSVSWPTWRPDESLKFSKMYLIHS